MNQVIRGIIFSFLALAIFFATILPSSTFGQSTGNQNQSSTGSGNNNTNTTSSGGAISQFGGNTDITGGNQINYYTGATPSSNSPAVSYTNGSPATQTNQYQTALADCLGGKAISGFIKNQIGGLVNSDQYTKVGVQTVSDPAKRGSSDGTVPSFDSIAYCLLNEVLAKVTNDTIAWINNGFNGNPAFVDDPQQFFTDLANNEAAQFIQQVAYGTTGVNICQPFRVQIATGLNNAYNNGYAQQSSCTLGSIGQNIQNFQAYTSGAPGGGAGSLQSLWNVGVQGQNQYNGYLLAQQELSRRISLQQNTATVDLSNGSGFLSYKECTPAPDKKDAQGNPVKQPPTCKIVTPGKVIEQQLNNRLSSGNNRLVLADKFDQVVDALVQQLIKTALNQVLSQ